MTQANKDIATRFFTALGKGDRAAMADILAPNVTAIAMGSGILSGKRNFEEVIGALGMLSQITKNGIEFKIISMTAEEDRVSAEVEGYSTLVNGASYNNVYHMLFTVKDGKIILVKEYFCTKTADTAIGPLLAAG